MLRMVGNSEKGPPRTALGRGPGIASIVFLALGPGGRAGKDHGPPAAAATGFQVPIPINPMVKCTILGHPSGHF